MIEEDPLCPECGWELTGIKILKDDEQKIIIEFFCDEAADDRFRFQIITGIPSNCIPDHGILVAGFPYRRWN